jgi:hypothetical protein
VKDQVKASRMSLAGDFEGHPSFRRLLSQGYQVIAF